jgi:hypothetical protein
MFECKQSNADPIQQMITAAAVATAQQHYDSTLTVSLSMGTFSCAATVQQLCTVQLHTGTAQLHHCSTKSTSRTEFTCNDMSATQAPPQRRRSYSLPLSAVQRVLSFVGCDDVSADVSADVAAAIRAALSRTGVSKQSQRRGNSSSSGISSTSSSSSSSSSAVYDFIRPLSTTSRTISTDNDAAGAIRVVTEACTVQNRRRLQLTVHMPSMHVVCYAPVYCGLLHLSDTLQANAFRPFRKKSVTPAVAQQVSFDC